MLSLRTLAGQALDLLPDASITLEANNFLLAPADDNGSYSLPFTIPRSPANQQALDFPETLDHARGAGRTLADVDLFDDGRHLLRGSLRLLRLTAAGYELSLSYGTSAVMAKLKAQRLRDLELGGLRVWKYGGNILNYYQELAAHMTEVVNNPESYDYIFAPYSNNSALAEHPDTWPHYANFNQWGSTVDGSTGQVTSSFLLSSGYVTNYPVMGLNPVQPWPGFYPVYKASCCPCVKLRYLVYTLLQELGIPFEEDFFDAETSQLVVVSNAVADDPLITGWKRAHDLGLGFYNMWFHLPDVLPDLTAAELLRKLADTFFLDISVSPLGVLRLRRSRALLQAGPQLELSRVATPAPGVDVSAELPRLATSYLTESDDYTGKHYRVVDPHQLGDPVSLLADLPQLPDFPHQVRLVQQFNHYYQYNDTKWEFYSERLDTPELGLRTSSVTVQVTQGIELMLELLCPQFYLLPGPDAKWEPGNVTAQPAGVPRYQIPVFGQRGYAPTYNCIERSQSLRLAFYRGLQPYLQPGDGLFPMLAAGSGNVQGFTIGSYSLRLHGADGTVAQFGSEVLALRANPYTVSWPVWLNEEQLHDLDLARTVGIDGLEYAIRKVSLTLPLRQPAQLDLVLKQPALNLQAWQQ